MEKYKGLSGRDTLVRNLAEKYSTNSAETLMILHAGCGQGKSYIINTLLDALSDKEINILKNFEDELRPINRHQYAHKLNALGVSGGALGFSLGFSLGWKNPVSQYEKIRSILLPNLKKNILICVDSIEDISDELRFLVFQIIINNQRLECDYHIRIFFLITTRQNSYIDDILAKGNSAKIIALPKYEKYDIRLFFEKQKKLLKIDYDKIFELCHGNLNLADFIYEEIAVNDSYYLDTLNDIVNRRIAIIKEQGIKKELGGKDIEDIIFSASLAIKRFTARYLHNIIEKNISVITDGLEIACNESLMEKDIKYYYGFISEEIQNYIAQMTANKREDLFIQYYNYYAQNEPDEYFIRAYYIYKYQKCQLGNLSESLFLLAYSLARKLCDTVKTDKIERIFLSNNEDDKKRIFCKIKKLYDNIFNEADVSTVTQDYYDIQKQNIDTVLLAEISCEYLEYIYKKTPMNTPHAINLLYRCVEYAKNELFFDASEIEGIIQIDETILRLKIIYSVSPCVLDQKNDYETFQMLYNLSKELTKSEKNSKKRSIGEYIENVFNRKAFLFVNQAVCDVYYEKAKRYFAQHEIWIEYYITLVCQAGTYLVIQEFDKAIEICNRVEQECAEKDIKLPIIEKLYNNRIIADFLLKEQQAKSISKAICAAKQAVRELKKQINKSSNATQFVILTNICSLCLYSGNRKEYSKYKHTLEKLYNCNDIADISNEGIDDFYRYYFGWFELYCAMEDENWKLAEKKADLLKGFVPALFRKQEVFWEQKITAVKKLISTQKKKNSYDFCNKLVETKRQEKTLSRFFNRGLMVSDIQYTSYF